MNFSTDQVVRWLDRSIRFLCYVLIFWLPYSPAAVETVVIISLILWMIKRALTIESCGISNAFALPPSYLNASIGIFVLICLASVSGSPFFSVSLRGFFTKTLEWFVVYFLILEVFTQRKHVVTALIVLAVTASATVFDSLYQFYISSKDIFLGHMIEPLSRATAGFKTSNGLGGYLTMVVPVFWAMAFFVERKVLKVLLLFLCIFSLWSLYVTQSRGAWVGVGFGLALGLFSFVQVKKSLKGLVIVGAAVIGLLAVLGGSNVLKDVGSLERRNNVSWRWGVWQDTVTMIADRPMIGHGLNTYMKVFQAYRQKPDEHATYAHNSFLQIAAETGLFGLLSFALMIAKALHSGFKSFWECIKRKDSFGVLILGVSVGVVAFLVQSFVDNNFYALQLSVHFWLMTGVLMAAVQSLRSKPLI
jgi:O-antigen ligase